MESGYGPTESANVNDLKEAGKEDLQHQGIQTRIG